MKQKKQVVFIHGATGFSRYDDFLRYLKTTPIDDPLADSPKRWKHTLREDLGIDYEVFLLSMPNKQNAKYREWQIWFERYFEFLRDGVVLIGHSQGGCFLAKYVSENTMPMCVRALFLIAAPAGPDDFGGEDGGDFQFTIEKLPEGIRGIEDVLIFHSKDDPVVSFEHAQKYQKVIPKALLISFKSRGHFNTEDFPELLEQIRNLDS